MAVLLQTIGLGIALCLVQTALAINTSIDLGYATYQGKELTNGINQYLGIRYAAPPLGDLRFRAPAAPKNQTQVQDASSFRTICLGINRTANAHMSEDCLFANVWAPSNATETSKLPVMVFIQGGGYTTNADDNWNGTQLVEVSGRNIVYVNFNYRVGLWGFLASQEVEADGKLNVGLLDQRFLLQWVQRHISKFGGDPNHVVIEGMSAGAGSVALHLTNYGGRNDGLFVGAIAESTFLPWQPQVAEVEWQYNATLQATGCVSASNHMSCLRGLSSAQLQSVNVPRPYPGEPLNPLFYWTPVVDGDMIRGNQYDQFDSGKVVKVPVLFGTCTNEGTYFAPNASSQSDIAAFMDDNYPHLNSTVTKSLLSQYPLKSPVAQHAAWFPSASTAYGEATFICPTISILNSLSADFNGSSSRKRAGVSASQIWAYRFNVHDMTNTAAGLGVPHIFEASAVYGPTQVGAGNSFPSFETYNAGVVPVVQRYWLSFVQKLDPNALKESGAPEWEVWSGQQRLLFQSNSTAMEVVTRAQEKRCAFWKAIRSSTEQ